MFGMMDVWDVRFSGCRINEIFLSFKMWNF